jgi:hypothetical protein
MTFGACTTIGNKDSFISNGMLSISGAANTIFSSVFQF